MTFRKRITAFANHGLVVNTFHLAVMRLVTFVAPLLALWHLLDALGLDGYGVVAFGMALVQLAALLTDMGLTMAAIRKASLFREKKRMLRRLLGGVVAVKFLASMVYSAGILIFAFSTTKYADYRPFLVLLPFSIVLFAIQPGWLFLGIEQSRTFARITIVGKGVYLAAIFLLVKAPDDYMLTAIADAAGQFVIAALSYYNVKKLGIPLSLPTMRHVTYAFKSGLGFFVAGIASASYQNTALIVLGFFSPPVALATFSVAEQFYKALIQVFAPLSLALYPYMTRTKNSSLLLRAMVVVVALLVLIVAAEPFVASFVLGLINVSDPEAVQSVLRILMFALVFQVVNMLNGHALFTLFDRIDLANKTVLFGAATYLAMVLSLAITNQIGLKTIAWSLVATELSVLTARLLLWIRLQRRNKQGRAS